MSATACHSTLAMQARIREFNGMEVGYDQFLVLLRGRIATADIRQVKADVLPFVRNPQALDIWSNNYFLHLADRIKLE